MTLKPSQWVVGRVLHTEDAAKPVKIRKEPPRPALKKEKEGMGKAKTKKGR